jgi:hypothetical protein
MRVRPVAKPGRDPCPERHNPPHAHHSPDQPVPPRLGRAGDRHKILDLADSALREETGDQHVGIREIELPGLCRQRGGQLKTPTAVRVQNRSEKARGVERRAAMPVDGPVGSHQRHSVQITNQPMLRHRQVAGTTRHTRAGLRRPAGVGHVRRRRPFWNHLTCPSVSGPRLGPEVTADHTQFAVTSGQHGPVSLHSCRSRSWAHRTSS